jgi:hypothetical protein
MAGRLVFSGSGLLGGLPVVIVRGGGGGGAKACGGNGGSGGEWWGTTDDLWEWTLSSFGLRVAVAVDLSALLMGAAAAAAAAAAALLLRVGASFGEGGLLYDALEW